MVWAGDALTRFGSLCVASRVSLRPVAVRRAHCSLVAAATRMWPCDGAGRSAGRIMC